MLELGPREEIFLAGPDRVRRIEHMIFALGAAQQVEFDKAFDLLEPWSRESQTFSKAFCSSLRTLKRFIAMNIGFSPALPLRLRPA